MLSGLGLVPRRVVYRCLERHSLGARLASANDELDLIAILLELPGQVLNLGPRLVVGPIPDEATEIHSVGVLRGLHRHVVGQMLQEFRVKPLAISLRPPPERVREDRLGHPFDHLIPGFLQAGINGMSKVHIFHRQPVRAGGDTD